MRANQRAAGAGPSHQLVDIDDLLDDPELERLHAERLAALQRQVERRAVMQQKGHGAPPPLGWAAVAGGAAHGAAAPLPLLPAPLSTASPQSPHLPPPCLPLPLPRPTHPQASTRS